MERASQGGSQADVRADAPASRWARSAAAAWWAGYHIPRLFLNYHAVRWARSTAFRLLQRRGRERSLLSEESRRLVAEFHRAGLVISERYLGAETLRGIEALVESSGCREAVRRRKAAAAGDPDADFFHLSQEPLTGEARRTLMEQVLPRDLTSVLELARGRALRLLSVTYHETDPADPTVQVGDSLYNAHPFHVDGNPKFAKLLVYLSDVGEGAGPFEVFPGSRLPLGDELVRLAYQPKQARRSGLAARLRPLLPARLRRSTHFWDADARELERRHGAPVRVLGPRGTLVLFDGMDLHNGSRDQKEPRAVLHFVFA